jgi:hypothetical protein
MQYVLGNMLNGGGINPDGLSLDLQFAADKTLTARRGPTPVFTRGSTGTFVGSNGLIQSAAINTPRFDHDPVTLACKGLLIEEGRTNLVTQSGNASSWPNTNGTVTNNGSTTAPDGSSNGFLGGIGTASLVTPATSSVTGLHTASVFLKRNNTDWARVQVAKGSFAHAVNFWVNLATGAAGTLKVAVGTPTSLSAQVTPFGNSWYRVSITASYPATDSLTLTVISATADNSTTRVSGSVYEVWGGQLEAGSFPTSYIPTTTGTLARSADVSGPIVDDGALNINQQEGTLLIEFTRELTGSTSSFKAPLRIWASSAINDYAGIDFHDSLLRSPLRTSNTTVFTNSVADAVLGGRKMAFSWKSGSSVSVIDSVVRATTAATFAFPSVLDTLGFAGITSAAYSGRIASIRYYRKRLSNEKLQSLTA